MILLVFAAIYLACGFVMCWQSNLPYWWAPIAPALAIWGLFIFVHRDLWLRITGRRKQAEQEWAKSLMEVHDSETRKTEIK